MTRIVLPPPRPLLPDGARPGGWWHATDQPGQVVCDLCPRECTLRPGDRGFCFVRENRDGEMVLSTYGRSTGFCIDPIEKKPLNHFYPGSSVLSFGTAGCNLGCKFCQNWSISKSREVERLSETATPAAIAEAAREWNCRSVAFTYNDPVIWAEYAIDVARACHEVGVKTVAVTAGYISPAARGPFYEVMDAANVDLKGFTEDFYWKLTSSHLQPVLDTLRWLKAETNVWFEITNLIIPQANDSADELKQLCEWVLEACGPDVPVHFTAFHPDFKLTDRGPTPAETLLQAYEIARRVGLHYPYVGNIQSPREQTTYCPNCRQPVIQRSGYQIHRYDVPSGVCRHCQTRVAGHFDPQAGNWGSRRQPVRIADYQPPLVTLQPAAVTSPTSPSSLGTTLVPRPEFTAAQGTAILAAGAEILSATVEQRPPQLADPTLAGSAALQVIGAFVTAKRAGHLRSCCGMIGQLMPLGDCVAVAAERTANDDPRFPPITAGELPFLHVYVWILHSPAPVTVMGEARRDALVIGKHGLTIARGNQRGLLLPGVAVEHQLDAEGFLRQVCLKAGLPPTAWKEPDVQLGTFEGVEFAGEMSQIRAGMPAPRFQPTPQFSAADLDSLATFCRGNILAAVAGATPNYFAFGVADGNVNGVVVTFRLDASRWWQANRLSLKERIPLQSTLFSIAENLGRGIAQGMLSSEELRSAQLELAILTDTEFHGTAAAADLGGILPEMHAVAVLERNKAGVVFQPGQSPAELLQGAIVAGKILTPATSAAYTLTVQTNAGPFTVSQVPRGVTGPQVRPPAVAGTFYPSDPAELAAVIDRYCPAVARKERWPAVMVPHAGLIFSGALAGETLSQVEIPKTVIILGPKHTPYGVEWGIAPHHRWSIPGGELAADHELAVRLAAAIPGLELDAAAHEREHGIEVELPFLAKLAPACRVVGITIGGGDYARCQEFARGLAAVIRELPEPPLLVISSDMNHYASDAENRRLDAMALAALETLDSENLLQVVQENQISMCGVLPAVIVMETLRLLGGLKEFRRVGYTTSAAASGDTSRVVGYAGMLLK